MATCKFCGREFAGSQAVRAHLKSCEPYREHRAARQEAEAGPAREPSLRQQSLRGGSLGRASLGSTSADETGSLDLAAGVSPGSGAGASFDPVRQLDQQIAVRQRRLKLRELDNAEDDIDRRSTAKEQEREREEEVARRAEADRQALQKRKMDERKAQEERERAKQARARRRRDQITAAKREVIDRWLSGAFVSGELKAEMLVEIERELSALPADDLPLEELVRIATGIRDRLHAAAERKEEDDRRRDRENREREQERIQRRQKLIRHGSDYAKRELSDVEGLDISDKWRIERRIDTELEDIIGDESSAEIEDLIDDILEREGIGYDDDDYDDE